MAAEFYTLYAPAHDCADPRNSCEVSADPDQSVCFESLTSTDYLYSPDALA